MNKALRTKKRNQHKQSEVITQESTGNDVQAFTFGGAERINNPAAYDDVEFDEAEGYYSLPIDPDGLSKMMRANSYHGSLVEARTRILSKDYIQNDVMTFTDMMNVCKDLVGFGQACIQIFSNLFGVVVRIAHVPMLPIRKGKNNRFVRLNSDDTKTWFKKDEIFHIKMYDPNQNIYGLPDYLSGLESALLSEDATKFRRRYYKNGAHLGFILFTSDPNITPAVEDALEEALSGSRGHGNFKSIHLNIPNGDKDSVKLLPIGDTATKDEFASIKEVSSQDVMVAHRFPAGISGINPSKGGNMGDPEKYSKTYYENEIRPLQKLIMGVNKILPKDKQIAFENPLEEK